MAANYSTFALACFCCLFSFFVLVSTISLDFNFSSPGEVNPCDKALKCFGDACFANSVIELTKNDRSRESNASQGRVWYANPVPLWDAATGELASFSIVFSFLITLDTDYKNPDGSFNTGDGIAFFLARYSDDGGGVLNNTGGGGGNLGLFNNRNHFNATGDDRVVAVEFDTFWNTWDTSAQHVGIDVNSISSVASSTYRGMDNNLTSNLRMTAYNLHLGLDKHIYNTDSDTVLTWARYKIIVGLGSALRYLHREWEQCVIHGDIKPSNIMLDSSYNTKLGDFGLARLGDHGTGPQTTQVKGTMGYIDPKFVNTSRRSTQSDIYSFGVVLLEIVSGKPPVSRYDPSFMLVKWVESLYSQGKILDAADARLMTTGDEAAEQQMERALVVGLWCALREAEQRPSVADAMYILQSKDKLPELPSLMYRTAAATSLTVGDRGASESSFSSGVRSSATTVTCRSSESFDN